MLTTSLATTQQTSKILCYYFNSTYKMQLVRVVCPQNYSFEKVVFPQQRILFETIPEGQLEVYVEQKGKVVLQENPNYKLQAN